MNILKKVHWLIEQSHKRVNVLIDMKSFWWDLSVPIKLKKKIFNTNQVLNSTNHILINKQQWLLIEMHAMLPTSTASNGLYLCLKTWLKFFLCIGRNYKQIHVRCRTCSHIKKSQKEFNLSYARQFKNHLDEGVPLSWS